MLTLNYKLLISQLKILIPVATVVIKENIYQCWIILLHMQFILI